MAVMEGLNFVMENGDFSGNSRHSIIYRAWTAGFFLMSSARKPLAGWLSVSNPVMAGTTAADGSLLSDDEQRIYFFCSLVSCGPVADS